MSLKYFTLEELADYLGITQEDFPDNIQNISLKAEAMIDYVTMNRIDVEKDYMDKVKLAAMSQVEFYLDNGTIENQGVTGYSIGGFSVNMDSNVTQSLSPWIRRYLRGTGLLYRGVNLSRTDQNLEFFNKGY